MKKKKCEHYIPHLQDVCTLCGKTRDEIADERYQEEVAKEKARKEKERQRQLDISSDALGGHSSIQSWENSHGRGFWGSSANGYVEDKYNR